MKPIRTCINYAYYYIVRMGVNWFRSRFLDTHTHTHNRESILTNVLHAIVYGITLVEHKRNVQKNNTNNTRILMSRYVVASRSTR